MPLRKEDMKVRLLRHREIRGSHWIWTGARIHPKKIYGLIEHTTVHRASWLTFVGPIPDGYEVHHRCPIKLCFKPAHLRLVEIGPHRVLHNLSPDICKNGHPRTPENTYMRRQGWMECRECKRKRDRR